MPHYADTSQYSIQEISLWKHLIENQHRTYHTAKGLSFTYEIRRLTDVRGSERGSGDGDKSRPENGWSNELFISRKQKSITRATVNMAYRKALQLMETDGCVKGPKSLNVFGASYIYAVFVELGIIFEPSSGFTVTGSESND